MITVYEKSTCSKCRETKKILDEAGVPYEEVFYHDTPLSENIVRDLLEKLDMTPRELLRTGEDIYRELDLKDPAKTDDELIAALATHPDLMQRPIVVDGDRAVLGRPPENVKELL